jgi:mRNA interferase RelE/StbE
MYEVVVPKSVTKQIRHLPVQVRGRVLEKVATLAAEPRPAACRKLVAEDDLYRLRVGDYRIVYFVDDSSQRVVISRVAHRREVYR